jgi:hypothetical protein
MMYKSKSSATISALALLALVACNQDDANESSVEDAGSTGQGQNEDDASVSDSDGGIPGSDAAEPEPAVDPLYAVGAIVFGDQGSTGYVKLVDDIALGGEGLTLEDADEFSGSADLWARGGALYLSGGDAPTVTKYSVGEDGKLAKGAAVNFGAYGVTDTAFWNATFVSDEKAYMVSGPTQLVAWNPTTMRITGTVELPELPARGALLQRLGMADRTAVVHDGKLYQTIYWTDATYADRAPESVIIVIDTETDEVVDQVAVDCPGLDYGTIDDDGQIHFSNWTGGVGTYYVLGTAQNCIAKLDPSTLEVSRTMFADIADGHEGSAFAYAGDGRFILSVFDEVRADAASADEPFAMLGKPNWQLWLYDPAAGSAAPVEGVDWNSGASIHTRIGDTLYSMIPGEGYATTAAYAVSGSTAEKLYDVTGWSFRLFQVR